MVKKPDVKILMKGQLSIQEQMQQTLAAYQKKKNEKVVTKQMVLTYIDIVESQWHKFENSHIQICEIEKGDAVKYFEDKIYEKVLELYIDFVSSLKENVDDLNVSTATPELQSTMKQGTSSEVKLPHISIPKFDGSYTTWRSFRDLFLSLIHRDVNLSKVQKMHYLKSNVIGEAERLLRQFDVSEVNYQKAWECLEKRYNNPKVLINTQLKKLTNQQVIKNESASSIRMLIDITQESLHELNSLDISTDNWDTILVHLISQKLPSETLSLWEQHLGNTAEYPSFNQLMEFLETRFRILESIQDNRNIRQQPSSSPKESFQKTKNFLNEVKCIKCNENHDLFRCSKFKSLTVPQRLDYVKTKKLCFNCFSSKHQTVDCKSKRVCKKCNKKHNTLLHTDKNEKTSEKNNEKSTTPQKANTQTLKNQESQTNQSFFNTNVKQVLLSTALVKVNGPKGKAEILRALIDSGSQSSFITRKASRRLGLSLQPADMQISGLQQTATAHAVNKVKLKIEALTSTFNTNMEAYVLDKITNLVPSQYINPECFTHISGLKLADPRFFEPNKIDILLGADIYAEILQEGIIRQDDEKPVAQATKLGWILFGNIYDGKAQFSSTLINQINPTLNELNKNLKSFWEIEEISSTKKLSPEEILCEKLYESTYKRHEDGHYSVLIPFKNNENPDLGFSRSNAIAQFLQLEKKFTKNVQFQELYKTCIQEYLHLGHMREVPKNEVKDQQKIQHYYMPHHGVLKESSSTTKLRVVFNASCKTSNNKSLNEQMLIGPKIQSSLWTILMRWRNYKYAFTADIEKMYRMVSMRPEHQNYQRIIWRNNPNDEIKDYALTTVTFGTASAPFLAIRTLKQLALDESKNFKEASEGILNQCYVDDVNLGGFDIEETKKLQQDLIILLKKGGFNLRKWTANDVRLLEHIPEEHRELKQFLELTESDSIKTLGIKWYPAQDNFGFSVNLPENKEKYSKRIIPSEVATLFDTFGS